MDDSLGCSDSEKELKHELVDVGIKLLTPPSSPDELLTLLDKVEDILSGVGQDPSRSMRDALFPFMKALISTELLRHPIMDVKISVVSCITEILRITAPCQPYDDEKMKEIFELTVIAFEKLCHLSGHCYFKALQILETVAKVRSCVMLLDLGCDTLIVQIFQLFLDTIGLNHPHSVFSNMEETMIWLIDESDDISLELLKPLLASVKKENQTISPLSWKLGEEVLKCCSAKIKPYISKAVKLMRANFDDYGEIVASLCQDEPSGRNLVAEDVKPDAVHLMEVGLPAVKHCEPLQDDGITQKRNDNDIILKDQNPLKIVESLSQLEQLKCSNKKSGLKPEAIENGDDLEAKADAVANPRKRRRKPNSLMKPEEGYKHSWTGRGKISFETPHERENHENAVSLPRTLSPNRSPLPPKTLHVGFVNSPTSQDHFGNDTGRRRRGRPKKENTTKGLLLLDQVKENGEQNVLTMGPGNAEDAEGKPRRGSRRKKSSTLNDKEAIAALSMIVPKKENDFLSDSEGKPCFVLDPMDGTKAIQEKAILEKQNTKEFVEKGFKRATFVKEYGEELVGSRIKVWWPLDQMFYDGVINSFIPSTKKHEVLYVDGDQEILNLNKERWVLLDDVSINQDQGADLHTSAVLSVKSERTKAKKMTKFKVKLGNSVSSAKRSKRAPWKCGSKSAESSAVDALCVKELDNAKTNTGDAEKDHNETQK